MTSTLSFLRRRPRAAATAVIAACGLAASGLVAPSVTNAAEAADATAQHRQLAEECWSTPGMGWPWSVTCIRGPHRYKAQCDMMRNDKINKGHEVTACRVMTWGGVSGWYFYYSFYTH
jgi:hypothetical protein